MIFKVSVLVVAALFQVAYSQQQGQPGYYGQGMTAAQMWDPNAMALPYYTAAANAWSQYFKKAQEASHQLYQQWDKSGASDLMATGMNYAQMAATEAQKAAQQAQKAAEAAMKQAQEVAMKGVMG